MLKRIKKDIFKLFAGGLMAQAIVMIAAPFITRIYTPQQYGVYQYILILCGIYVGIGALRYDQAINIAKKYEIEIIKKICIIIYGATLPILIVFVYMFSYLFKKEAQWLDEFKGNLFAIVVLFYLTSIHQLLANKFVRIRSFDVLVQNRIIFSILSSVGLIVSGLLFGNYEGMILSQIIAIIIAIIILKTDFKKIFKETISIGLMNKKIKKYSQFPKFDVFSTILNLTSNQIPILMMGFYAGPDAFGAYLLAIKMLMVPSTLISNAVLEDFRTKALISYTENGNCRKLYLKTLLLLITIGAIPSLIMWKYGNIIFVLVFGQNWIEAGEISQIIIFSSYFSFIVNPLSAIILISGKQKFNMSMNMLLVVSFAVLSYWASFEWDTWEYLKNIMMINVVFYIVYIVQLYRYSVKEKNDQCN